jgi:uncharacterized membrane protein YhhN
MKPVSLLFLFLFIAALAMDCVLVINQPESNWRYLSKGLLMPLLFMIITFEIEQTDKWVSVRLISLALLFSFIGDLVLLGEDTKTYFALGLGFFLLAHICYILFFYRKRPFRKKNSVFLFSMSIGILSLILAEIVLMWTKMERQGLAIPVVIYCLTIGFMLLCAANLSQSQRLHKNAVMFFVPGALLFAISDSIIGLNRYYFTRPLPGISVMLTYAAAQFLIVMGAIRFIRK